jgi:LCP family protein required for cell wall assembly
MATTTATPTRHRSAPGTRSTRGRQRGRHVSTYGEGFGRFAGVSVLSLIPGAGLIATGRRVIGGALLTAFVLTVGTVGYLALRTAGSGGGGGRSSALLNNGLVDAVLSVAVSPGRLMAVAVTAVLVAAAWALTVLASAWRARPRRPTPLQGLLGVALVAGLCTAIIAPSVQGARYALIQRDLVTSVFPTASGGVAPVKGAVTPKATASDPWQDIPRVNLLLLGSDAGPDRTGIRTDSMMVVSIDTRTGNSTLIGLPRNLQNVPFPSDSPLHAIWPNGFNCPQECLLNAVWHEADTNHPGLFKGVKNPGLTTLRGVVSEVTGLRIDNYAVIDLAGFEALVDAMGGVDVNVPRAIPIGGGDNQLTGGKNPISGYIQPGKQHLNGYEALWFSRSRTGSDDYDRMKRQRCMVGNLVGQVNPVQLLSKYPQLAAVAQKNISTDVGQDQLRAWVMLVERMQKGKIKSLPFTSAVISPGNPDFAKIRALVQAAINPPPPAPAAASTGSATSSGGTPKPATTPTSGSAQELSTVC